MKYEGYSFTFTIPFEKYVYYASKRRKYGSLSQTSQWKFLNNLMLKSTWLEHYEFIDYVFETHEDGRLHIHGYAIVKEIFSNLSPVLRLRDNFYTLNKIVGIKQSVYLKLSDIQETYYDSQYWFDYIQKHQHNILFKSSYQMEIEENKKLDYCVKIVSNTRTKSPEPEYYDTYRFTGEKNKFLVIF